MTKLLTTLAILSIPAGVVIGWLIGSYVLVLLRIAKYYSIKWLYAISVTRDNYHEYERANGRRAR